MRTPTGRIQIGALTGVAVFGFSLAAFLMNTSTPSLSKNAEQITHFYDVHETRTWVAVWFLILAGIAFVFFAGYLFQVLRAGRGSADWMPYVSLVSGGLLGLGYLVNAGINATLVDAANTGKFTGDSIRALNALSNDMFVLLMFAMAAFMLANALAILRPGAPAAAALPRWFGWSALVLGVAGLIPWSTWIAFPLAGLWILVASVLLALGAPGKTGAGTEWTSGAADRTTAPGTAGGDTA